MFRNMPSLWPNRSVSRLSVASVDAANFHSTLRRSGKRLVGQHRRARAVAEQAGADENAGVVIEIKRRAANFNADGENSPGAPGGENGLGRPQIRQGGAAALAHQIQGEDIRAQAKPFADVARQARAQIAGAGADEDGVNFIGRAVRVPPARVARPRRRARARGGRSAPAARRASVQKPR